MTPIIRFATVADASSIQRIYRPAVELEATSFETDVPSVEDISQRISATLLRTPWLVYNNGGEVLGTRMRANTATARRINGRSRSRRMWTSARTGAGSDARCTRRSSRSSRFRIPPRLCRHHVAERRERGLHSAVGFTAVGVYRAIGFKHGAWHDVAWYRARPAGITNRARGAAHAPAGAHRHSGAHGRAGPDSPAVGRTATR